MSQKASVPADLAAWAHTAQSCAGSSRHILGFLGQPPQKRLSQTAITHNSEGGSGMKLRPRNNRGSFGWGDQEWTRSSRTSCSWTRSEVIPALESKREFRRNCSRTALLCSTKSNLLRTTSPRHELDIARKFLLVKLPLNFIEMSIRTCIWDALDGMKDNVTWRAQGTNKTPDAGIRVLADCITYGTTRCEVQVKVW